MAYFPAMIQLTNRKVLLIGGGKIALEKLQKLLDFTTDITLLAKEFSQDIETLIKKHQLVSFQQNYKEGVAKGYDIVIAAVDDIELQKRLYHETREYKCLYNAVDVPELCDFIFPSYFKEGDLLVAISTSGASPAFAKQLRRYIQELLPQGVAEFLQEMKEVRKKLPKGKERMKLLEQKAKDYIQGWKHGH